MSSLPTTARRLPSVTSMVRTMLWGLRVRAKAWQGECAHCGDPLARPVDRRFCDDDCARAHELATAA